MHSNQVSNGFAWNVLNKGFANPENFSLKSNPNPFLTGEQEGAGGGGEGLQRGFWLLRLEQEWDNPDRRMFLTQSYLFLQKNKQMLGIEPSS